MKQLVKVLINSNHSDKALFLNGGIITTFSSDPSAENNEATFDSVAQNLSSVLSLPIIELFHAPNEGWDWCTVTADLIKNGSICKSSANELLNTTIKDTSFRNSTNPEFSCEYTLMVKKSDDSNQLYVSIYDKELGYHENDTDLLGLHAVICIRNGLPFISTGIDSDEDIFHVFSNTSNLMMVLPEVSSGFGIPFENLNFCHDKFRDARELIANRNFENCDFGRETIAAHNGWSVDGDCWVKVIFFDNPNGDSIKREYEINFKKDSTHIVSCYY